MLNMVCAIYQHFRANYLAVFVSGSDEHEVFPPEYIIILHAPHFRRIVNSEYNHFTMFQIVLLWPGFDLQQRIIFILGKECYNKAIGVSISEEDTIETL